MARSFTVHRPKTAKAPQGAGPAPTAKQTPKTAAPKPAGADAKPKEIGGPSGPEPTRYGDWERKGICVDF